MEKTIIFDVACDDYRVTAFSDDSVDLLLADGMIEHFDFQDDFFNGTVGMDGAVAAIKTLIVDATPLAIYSPSEPQMKATLKKQFIAHIKSEALDAFYHDDNHKSDRLNNSVVLSIYTVLVPGLPYVEAQRILRLDSMRKLVPCMIESNITVDINAAMKK